MLKSVLFLLMIYNQKMVKQLDGKRCNFEKKYLLFKLVQQMFLFIAFPTGLTFVFNKVNF